MVLVIYSAWSSPFELAFKKASAGVLLYIDLVVDVFFAIDIILTFFVAYVDKSTYLLIHDHKKIAMRYVTIGLARSLEFIDVSAMTDNTHFLISLSFKYPLKIYTNMILFRYITHLWFPLDVASTLPFQHIYQRFSGKKHTSNVFGFLNLLRLWRLRRVSELFSRLDFSPEA